MIYFAYGSNMLTARLVRRCPGAKEMRSAQLAGYRLRFDKRSRDGSGKGTIHSTSSQHDKIYGVLFDVRLTFGNRPEFGYTLRMCLFCSPGPKVRGPKISDSDWERFRTTPLSAEEQELIDLLQSNGRKLSPIEIYFSLQQARCIGDL
jgi:hypothetical protein